MKLIDLNRDRNIGSNALYLELGPFKILVDAGMHPKRSGLDATPNFDLIADYSLDLIILTHCHLDHLGTLPLVFRNQPQARVITSQPSLILAPRMLRNSHRIMSLQHDEYNIKEYPLFSHSDIDQLEEHLTSIPFERPRQFIKEGETLELTLYPAGHVAGACGCLLEYKHRKVFMTGDVLFTNQRTLPGASFPKHAVDTLVIETTRGAVELNQDYSRDNEIDRLLTTINNTLDRNGSCLIPVFALGRMQEMIAIFHEARRQKKLCPCPIYCSGLGIDLMDHFDTVARKTGLIHFRRRLSHDLKVKPYRNQPKPGKDLEEKAIYLLSSGMLVEKTPSYAVAAALIEHPHNSVCFVGYCDPDTPGGQLLATPHEASFLFKAIDYVCPVRAHIEQFDLSGHANREAILEFARQLNPRAIVLTHGDPDARDWFADSLAVELPKCKILDPAPNEPNVI